MTRRPITEPPLPLDFRQPRRTGRREGDLLYAAVVYLRRAGLVVYRSGTQHKVNGRHAGRELPPEMRTGHYAGPGPAWAPPARKPAKSKAAKAKARK